MDFFRQWIDSTQRFEDRPENEPVQTRRKFEIETLHTVSTITSMPDHATALTCPDPTVTPSMPGLDLYIKMPGLRASDTGHLAKCPVSMAT